jgi:F0F1-type ATP synthase assembly protein I
VVITSKEFLVGSVFSKLKLSKGLMAGLLLGGTLGSFGVAAATSSPSTTVFYACLNVKAGTINSINTTGAPKCGKGNVSTSWNAAGQKGDTGSQGVAGQQGDTGTSAPSGGWYVFLSAGYPPQVNHTTCPNGAMTTHYLKANAWPVEEPASGTWAWLCPY